MLNACRPCQFQFSYGTRRYLHGVMHGDTLMKAFDLVRSISDLPCTPLVYGRVPKEHSILSGSKIAPFVGLRIEPNRTRLL